MSTTTAGRQCLTAYRDRRRREAAHGLGLDPDTLRPLPRPPLSELINETDLLGTRDRLAALTALAHAESASRSAAALESIAAALARLAPCFGTVEP